MENLVRKYFVSKNTPYWLFTISLMILLIVPVLIQDGMFLDGELYTCVSNNLSHGYGTFWAPKFNPAGIGGSPYFLEQPPLVFGIQSLFFRLFGDSMYVERFYTFLTMCTTAILINLLWKEIFKKDEAIKKAGWLPVMFWITIPTTIWSYSNNMMENSMAIFDLAAVIIIYRALESGAAKTGAFLLAGVFIFLATLSKGVPGLFPLAIPFLYWLVLRNRSFWKAILSTAILFSVLFAGYLVLFNLPESRESLTFYVTKRLLGRINDTPTVSNRFYIIRQLFTEFIPQYALVVIIIVIAKVKKTGIPLVSNRNRAIFFFSAGLAASIPLTITLVQRGFYLVPSFPYFAIGFAALIAPVILNFKEKAKDKKNILMAFSIVLFLFSIGFSLMQKGKTQRDREMLYDVHLIGNSIPGKSEITINSEIASTYVLECYFIRYYKINLYTDESKKYLLMKKTDTSLPSSDYEKLNLTTKIYDLYQRK